jgi:hypothetical protein
LIPLQQFNQIALGADSLAGKAGQTAVEVGIAKSDL